MKILVVYNVAEELTKGQAEDILAERGVLESAAAIPESLRSRGYDVIPLPVVDDLAAALEPYDPAECVVFNLIESLDNGRVPETQATAFLESRGFVFTGSGTETLARAMHKMQTKEILISHSVSTPRAQVFSTPDEHFDLNYPVIIKPISEDAALGISADSVVFSNTELRQRVAFVLKTYNQPALVEEFIDGREINVSVLGNYPPDVLPLSEVDFSQMPDPRYRIVSYEAKWIEGSYGWAHTPVICPARIEPGIQSEIEKIAVTSYQALGCRDYARIDMRVRDSQIYVLEVNPNPDLSPGAGFVRSARCAGYDYAEIIARIVELAISRSNSQRTLQRRKLL